MSGRASFSVQPKAIVDAECAEQVAQVLGSLIGSVGQDALLATILCQARSEVISLLESQRPTNGCVRPSLARMPSA